MFDKIRLRVFWGLGTASASYGEKCRPYQAKIRNQGWVNQPRNCCYMVNQTWFYSGKLINATIENKFRTVLNITGTPIYFWIKSSENPSRNEK